MAVTCVLLKEGLQNGTANVKQYNAQGALSYAQVDVGYLVEVIGETDPKEVPNDAEAFVKKSIVPVGTPLKKDPQCRARGYRTNTPAIEAGDIVLVIVSFIFNEIAVSSTVWTVESGSFSEMLETNQNADDTPIKIANYNMAWEDPTIAPLLNTFEPLQFGTVNSPHSRKQWTYTKQIYSPVDAMNFDTASNDYQGCVNSDTFVGMNSAGLSQNLNLDPGTVFCNLAGITFNPYQGQYIARVVVTHKPEGWQPWASYFMYQIGAIPGNTWRAFGGHAANGIVRASTIPTANLNDLLLLI